MSDHPNFCTLWAVLIDWVLATGQERVDQLPGLWQGATDEWDVRLNGHNEEIDGVPPKSFELVHKTNFLGIASIGPFDGLTVGVSEDELIAHFQAAAGKVSA